MRLEEFGAGKRRLTKIKEVCLQQNRTEGESSKEDDPRPRKC